MTGDIRQHLTEVYLRAQQDPASDQRRREIISDFIITTTTVSSMLKAAGFEVECSIWREADSVKMSVTRDGVSHDIVLEARSASGLFGVAPVNDRHHVVYALHDGQIYDVFKFGAPRKGMAARNTPIETASPPEEAERLAVAVVAGLGKVVRENKLAAQQPVEPALV